ncbi:MAG: RHS repeat-associated core domain-containing protein [Planctomycetales bacterium]|nr:RHS repeat-associated core domain-containing protein [Planctomycetales bacterium]
MNLREGSVYESAIDLELPGPWGVWQQRRTYRHVSPDYGSATRLGTHWYDGMANMRIIEPFSEFTYFSSGASYLDDGSAAADYELRVGASGTARLIQGNTNTSGTETTYTVPPDWNVTVIDDIANHEFIVRELYTDRVYVFYDFHSSINANWQGRLKLITTRQWFDDTGRPGWSLAYDSAGRLTVITTPAPQATIVPRSIVYTYHATLTEKIAKVEVRTDTPSSTLLMQAEYLYWNDVTSPGTGLGGANDLVQVKVSIRDSSGGYSVRYTQYRYYTGLPEPTYAPGIIQGVVKAVYEHGDVFQLMQATSASAPEDLLALDDDDAISGKTPIDFASRAFEYYFPDPYDLDPEIGDYGDYDTSFANTIWTQADPEDQEDLEDAYGGGNYIEEAHDYRVRTEHIGSSAGCSACSGGNSGRISRNYYYLDKWQGAYDNGYLFHYWHVASTPNDVNEVTHLVIEDTIAYDNQGDPYPLYRKIYGLNDYNRLLREVLIENPHETNEQMQQALKCWCRAWTYVDADANNDNDFNDAGDSPHLKHRVAEMRMPSAYTVVNNEDLKKFLDPFDDEETNRDGTNTGWTNDNSVLNGGGVIYVYEYDNDQGLQTGLRIQNGHGQPAHYVSATDWGDGSDDQPLDRALATYEYPQQVTTRNDSSRLATVYEYDFYDSADTQIQQVTTKFEKVPTGENGAGTSGPQTTVGKYFDEEGRLRFSKDGEGYATYYSYAPNTGQLAYISRDAGTTMLPSEWSTPTGGNWLAWSGTVPTDLQRESTLPLPLSIVTKYEYDELGRTILRNELSPLNVQGGVRHYTAYQALSSGHDRVIRFPYWDSVASETGLPAQVTEYDEFGRMCSRFALPVGSSRVTSTTSLSGSPVVDISETSQYTQYIYDGDLGRLVETRSYHDVSGGSSYVEYDDYYSTRYLYDAEGRVGATIRDATSTTFQANVTLFDVLGRPVERRVAVISGTLPTDYADLSGALPSGYAVMSKTEYDSGGIGDSHVTMSTAYHTTTVHTDTTYHRTYRGHLRGVSRQYTDGSTSNVLPQMVYDLDWMGRTTAEAQYVSALTWTSVVTGDGYNSYTTTATDRHHWIQTHYDKLGRVYRTDRYPGAETTKHFQVDNYYDRNNRLVCTGDLYAANTEYAYDGVGRQYQVRTVKDAPSSPYSSGAFAYAEPAPVPGDHSDGVDLGMETGSGNGGVIDIEHMVYDDAGNVIETHSLELDAGESGIVFGDANHVRRTSYSWYDKADRLETSADYGSGDGSSSADSWALTTSLPSRGTAPTWTTAAVYDGYALLTKSEYNDAGRQSSVISGVAKNGSDTRTLRTSTFYDDLGRRTYVVENHDGTFNPATSNSSSPDENRETGWEYNGLGQVVTLSAYNSNSTVQTTKYLYEDPHNASLVTETIYPDSSDTTSSGTDQVKRTYNLDGSIATVTDQRQVKHTYSYNSRRQLQLDSATGALGTLASLNLDELDDSIQSIKREYNDLGQLKNVYSYGSSDGTGTRANGLWIQYYTGSGSNVSQAFWRQIQHHEHATAGSPQYVVYRNSNVTSNVYHAGNRVAQQVFPDSAILSLVCNDSGTINAWSDDDLLSDRLSRVSALAYKPAGGSTARTVDYQYNGISRVVSVDYVVPELRRSMVNRDSAGATIYNGWDRFGRTRIQEWDKYVTEPPSETAIDRFNYTYDYAGNRLSRDIPSTLYSSNERDQAYSYDGLLRLAGMTEGSAGSYGMFQSWTLDALGNWTQFGQDSAWTGGAPSFDFLELRTHNRANEIDVNDDHSDAAGQSIVLGIGGSNRFDPVYDAAGNMTEMPEPGQPSNGRILVWDAWNRLVQVKRSASNVAQANEYDGLNRRIVRHTDTNGNGTLETNGNDEIRHYYYNDKWQVVEERVGEIGKDARIDVQYVYHPYYIDAVAVRFRDKNKDYIPGTTGHNGLEEKLYYLQDANYNVTALANTSGAVVERYAYTPYGEVTVLHGDVDVEDPVAEWSVDATGTDVDNEILYTGRELDPVTGLQLNRHRFLHVQLGRFIGRDPIRYLSGQLSLYSYPAGDPIRTLDPFGLDDSTERWPVDKYPYLPPGHLYPPSFLWPWEDPNECHANEVHRGCVGLACERIGGNISLPPNAPGTECFDNLQQALQRLDQMEGNGKNKPCIYAFQSNAPLKPDPNRGPGCVVGGHYPGSNGFDYITLHCPPDWKGPSTKDCYWERMDHAFPNAHVIVGPLPESKTRNTTFCVVPDCKCPSRGGLGPKPILPSLDWHVPIGGGGDQMDLFPYPH